MKQKTVQLLCLVAAIAGTSSANAKFILEGDLPQRQTPTQVNTDAEYPAKGYSTEAPWNQPDFLPQKKGQVNSLVEQEPPKAIPKEDPKPVNPVISVKETQQEVAQKSVFDNTAIPPVIEQQAPPEKKELPTAEPHVRENQAEIKFPKISESYMPEGAFVDVASVRKMNVGLSKDQVELLLGLPHFNEGIGAKKWDYIFNFYTGKKDGEYVTCQYQITFKDAKTDSLAWKEPQCADFVSGAQKVKAVNLMTLNTDGMFAFGKSEISILDSEGRTKLDELAVSLKAASDVKQVSIEGHADRFGSDSDNLTLSEKRAESIKNYLVNHGVDGAKIKTVGMGESQPVVTCDGARTPSVIACLKPNRRITISAVKADY